MTDRELIEKVAKIIGLDGIWKEEIRPEEGVELVGIKTGSWSVWNPMTDDGDALRLAVKLRLFRIELEAGYSSVTFNHHPVDCPGIKMQVANQVYEKQEDDPYAATRRAIVRAAAELGEMK